MTISHNGHLIKKIYHNGNYIKEVYHGNSLVWKNNTVETNLFILNGGYDLPGGLISTGIIGFDYHPVWYYDNTDLSVRTAIMPCEPETKYRISMYVHNRMRVAANPTVPLVPSVNISGSYTPTWGNTENHNTYESIEYTTLSTSNFLFIYYWNTIDGDFHSCYDTINVIKVL